MMKKILVVTFILLGFFELVAQGFAGSLEFKYITQKDTTSNVYHVKNKLVKLDQFSRKGNNVEGSFLFDLAANEIKFLNPKRKLWGKQRSETPQIIKGVCNVTKGSATKKVAGINCHEYVVKNVEENTVVTYWIAEEKFNFFIPLIKLWNRKDKQSMYFGQIKGLPDGSMPLMSEEKQLTDGKLLTKLEVHHVNTKAPDDAAFSIPAGYTKFDQ